MHMPQIVVYEPDGRLKLRLEELAERRRWALREARRPETCLRLLGRGGPAVLIVKAGRDLERELALLERAVWLRPRRAGGAGGGRRSAGTGESGLGPRRGLRPAAAAAAQRLPEIVAGLMGEKAEAVKT